MLATSGGFREAMFAVLVGFRAAVPVLAPSLNGCFLAFTCHSLEISGRLSLAHLRGRDHLKPAFITPISGTA